MVRTSGRYFKHYKKNRETGAIETCYSSDCSVRVSDEDAYEVLDEPGHGLDEKLQRNRELKEKKEAKEERKEY